MLEQLNVPTYSPKDLASPKVVGITMPLLSFRFRWVQFATEEDAKNAIAKKNGTALDGMDIVVQEYKENT